MNIKEIPWQICAALFILLLIWKTPWMRVLEWLIMVGLAFAIVAGAVIALLVLICFIILPWTTRSKMCDPRVSLKAWAKIKAEKAKK